MAYQLPDYILYPQGTYLPSCNHAEIIQVNTAGIPPECLLEDGTKLTISKDMGTGCIRVGSMTPTLSGSNTGDKRIRLLDTKMCTVRILVWEDSTWYSPSQKRQIRIFPPDTKIVFHYDGGKYLNMFLDKGTYKEDNGFRVLQKFKELISFIECGVQKGAVEKAVNLLKKPGKTNTQLADEVIRLIGSKGTILGALAGVGGMILLPAEYLISVCKWMFQAEIAYALWYINNPNGRSLSSADFEKDLVILFAGESMANDVFATIGGGAKDEIKEKAVRALSGAALDKYIEAMGKKITEAQALAYTKTLSKTYKVGIPVVGALTGGIISAMDANSFGKFAKAYYSNEAAANTPPSPAPKPVTPASNQPVGTNIFSRRKAEIVNMVSSGRPAEILPPNGTAKVLAKSTSGTFNVAAISFSMHRSLETYGCTVHLLVWDDAWTKGKLIAAPPNAKVNFYNASNDRVTIFGYAERGNVKEETNFASVSRIEDLMAIFSRINKQKIQADVADWRRSVSDNDKLADHVINTKSAAPLATGSSGPVLMPVEFARISAQWLMNAEVAYAVACVYGSPPGDADFNNDLHLIFAGETYIKEILKEVGEVAALKTGERVKREWVQSDAFRRISGKVLTKLPEKVLKKITSKTPKALTETSPAFRTITESAINVSSAKSFGQQAKTYYKPTPPPPAPKPTPPPPAPKPAPAPAPKPAPAPAPKTRPTVRQGTKSDDVKYLQQRLNTLINAKLTTDGSFGSATLEAVKKFQASKKLTVDGVVGSATWAALG